MMAIPNELLQYKPWVLWRRVEVNGRIAKLPISPWCNKSAACDRPQTWSTFRHACYARRKFRSDGIGFVFTADDPFCGLDLDHCRNGNGDLKPEAHTLIRRFASYAEISPSGSGVHILIQGKTSGPGRRGKGIEIYGSGRYFTITGKQLLQSSCSIEGRQPELEEVLKELCANREMSLGLESAGEPHMCASEQELIQRAKTATNGHRFARLWAGDTSDFQGDHSRVDLALCRMLSFWCRGDIERIDRLFLRSSLMREKWDRLAGGLRYGERTILALSYERS